MKKNVLIIAAAVLATAVVLYSAFSIISLRNQLSSSQQQIEIFMNQTRDDLGYINETQDVMKQNAQQVRQYVNLPSLNFPSRETEETPGQEDSPQSGNFELAAYDAISYLNSYNRDLTYIQNFNAFLNGSQFRSFLESSGLDLRKTGDFSRNLLTDNEKSLFKMTFDRKEKQLEISSGIFEVSQTFGLEDPAVFQFLEDETQKQKGALDYISDLNSQLNSLYRDRNFRNSLGDLELYLGDPVYRAENLIVPVIRKDNSRYARITTHTADGVFLFQQTSFTDLSSLKEGVLEILSGSDLRTEAEILDDLVKSEVETLLEDEAFLAHLNKLGYTYRGHHREDNDYYYYDLDDSEGNIAGALALQKEFGEVYLMDRDDIPVRSLKTFAPDHELVYSFQNQEPVISDEMITIPSQGSETFLLIGSHEHNADTMILVHFNSIQEQVSMLSIPRDLYYKGMKINSIYRNYGPSRLMSDLSSITGLNISKYIAIDMYAFIDMVNILGGITVELDEPLIDPTYKVRENGRWSTLFYPAGEHHLDGVAALRIARSRHTSSDFERAVRQQKVIAALRDSIGSMGVTDVTKLYDFMQIAEKYLLTNFSTAEMVKYYLSYKDYKIRGQNVLNTDNVLYATYTNLYRLSQEEQESALADPDFYKGGWIVLPKNNDWNAIRDFVLSIMQSS